MKIKFVRDRARGRMMQITSQRGESLDTRRARWLAGQHSQLLLSFGYDMQRDGVGAVLRYDVDGMWSARTYLSKRTLGTHDLLGMLGSLQDVLDLSNSKGYSYAALLFDPRYVFVDARFSPSFAFVPLSDVPLSTANSPLAFVSALSAVSKLHFDGPDAQGISSRLEAFVLNQNNVFSANSFRRFLDAERKQAGLDAHEEMVDGSACDDSRSQGVAGGGDEPYVPVHYPTDGGGDDFFWWPSDEESQTGAGPDTEARITRTIVLRRRRTGEDYVLPSDGEIRVGRSSHCDIRLLGNPKISRDQALFMCSNGEVLVRDLKSSNGTWVDGRRLGSDERVSLAMGGHVQLADEDFVVRMQAT